MNKNISAAELIAKNPSALPKTAGEFAKYTFWQYTRLETADLILSSRSFRVSNLNSMNDLDEANFHLTVKDRVFALCFCNSDTEKIPMWYLYSGISGRGAALGLTPARMLRWLGSIKSVYGVVNGQKKEEGDALEVGRDVEMRFGWVYYQKASETKSVMYRNNWFTLDDPDEFFTDNYFLKAYPWEYEKEFRIVFINNTAKKYDAVFVDIPEEVQKAVKVRLAPEIKTERLAGLDLKCVNRTHIPVESGLSINMNLFTRNRTGFLEYLRDELAKSDPGIDPKELCGILREAKRCEKTDP